jgi:hypothetical protein
MRYRTVIALMAAAASVVGCTTTGTSPATAPDTTAPPAAPSTTTSVVASTTTLATTTTVDRLTEIHAIFEDLERRRLQAIYTGDVEAFASLFADTPYLEESLRVFDVIDPGPVPEIRIEAMEVLKDDGECIALFYESYRDDGTSVGAATVVLQPSESGAVYLFTNSGRGGWMCDGPHPLSG